MKTVHIYNGNEKTKTKSDRNGGKEYTKQNERGNERQHTWINEGNW